MSAQQLVQRFLTMEARVDAQKARTGKVKDEDFKELIDAAGRLFSADIFIDDTPSLSVMELRTKCRRLKSEHDIGLIRSEEHTSELQSRGHLVCRLLLE